MGERQGIHQWAPRGAALRRDQRLSGCFGTRARCPDGRQWRGNPGLSGWPGDALLVLEHTEGYGRALSKLAAPRVLLGQALARRPSRALRLHFAEDPRRQRARSSCACSSHGATAAGSSEAGVQLGGPGVPRLQSRRRTKLCLCGTVRGQATGSW